MTPYAYLLDDFAFVFLDAAALLLLPFLRRAPPDGRWPGLLACFPDELFRAASFFPVRLRRDPAVLCPARLFFLRALLLSRAVPPPRHPDPSQPVLPWTGSQEPSLQKACYPGLSNPLHQ